MHIRGNSGTSSGGIDPSRPPLTSYVPMTSIIRPQSCWLMQSRQVLLSSTPLPSISTHPALLPLFPVFSPLRTSSPVSIALALLLGISSYSYSCRPPLSSLLVSAYISVLYSFPLIIRSWQPPAGDNRGENQPWMSGCISSLRCLPASNEDKHCQNPASRCARHT